MSIELGQFWCVLGRNGCGKTSLLRAMAGLRPVEQGQIELDGRRLSEWPRHQLAQARALLPQGIKDAFSSTVFETVLAARFPHQRPNWSSAFETNSDDKEIVKSSLNQLGIETLASRDVLSLSGGERQRVAIAALLAQTPQLALVDEPTTHLDLDVQHLVMNTLKKYVGPSLRPAAVVASLHDVNLAERYASHVLLFQDDGNTLAGTREEVLTIDNLRCVYGQRLQASDLAAKRFFFVE